MMRWLLALLFTFMLWISTLISSFADYQVAYFGFTTRSLLRGSSFMLSPIVFRIYDNKVLFAFAIEKLDNTTVFEAPIMVFKNACILGEGKDKITNSLMPGDYEIYVRRLKVLPFYEEADTPVKHGGLVISVLGDSLYRTFIIILFEKEADHFCNEIMGL